MPKINGNRGEVIDILVELFNTLNNTKYKNDGYIENEQTKTMENQCESSEYKLSSKISYYICYNKYKILEKHRKSDNNERYNK